MKTLLIVDLNSLSAAPSYKEWLQIKAWASKQDQVFIQRRVLFEEIWYSVFQFVI